MLKTFLLQFDDKCYNSVGKFFEISDKDKALFYITYTLNPQKDAYYKGESFGNINTMFSRDIEQQSENFFEFIKSELFEFYLKANGYSDEVCGTVSSINDVALCANDVMLTHQCCYTCGVNDTAGGGCSEGSWRSGQFCASVFFVGFSCCHVRTSSEIAETPRSRATATADCVPCGYWLDEARMRVPQARVAAQLKESKKRAYANSISSFMIFP